MARKDVEQGGRTKKGLPALLSERGARPFVALQQEMNRLFDRFFGEESSLYPSSIAEEWLSTSYPQLDIRETAKGLKVSVELPGMSEKDVHVSITGNSLTIKGEKKEEKEEKHANYVRMERRYGSFNRVIPLSEEIDPDRAEATFKNGLLEIELPRSEKAESQRKRINIKTSH
jgi:HSP20 family protein